ncbi:unnamed protein product [Pleuronectes platessa]|uniref:Uncharacterized protein n=1 Tax=Pleuronectes platessa TaxID=8262 RepID=A0A9N7VZ67_PLEPL|nr:unnamed protein product [Pleuronectes platessa]
MSQQARQSASSRLIPKVHGEMEEIAGGRNIFALQDLTDMMTERLERRGIQKNVNRTRLKKTVLKHFPDLTEEKGPKSSPEQENSREILSVKCMASSAAPSSPGPDSNKYLLNFLQNVEGEAEWRLDEEPDRDTIGR